MCCVGGCGARGSRKPRPEISEMSYRRISTMWPSCAATCAKSPCRSSTSESNAAFACGDHRKRRGDRARSSHRVDGFFVIDQRSRVLWAGRREIRRVDDVGAVALHDERLRRGERRRDTREDLAARGGGHHFDRRARARHKMSADRVHARCRRERATVEVHEARVSHVRLSPIATCATSPVVRARGSRLRDVRVASGMRDHERGERGVVRFEHVERNFIAFARALAGAVDSTIGEKRRVRRRSRDHVLRRREIERFRRARRARCQHQKYERPHDDTDIRAPLQSSSLLRRLVKRDGRAGHDERRARVRAVIGCVFAQYALHGSSHEHGARAAQSSTCARASPRAVRPRSARNLSSATIGRFGSESISHVRSSFPRAFELHGELRAGAVFENERLRRLRFDERRAVVGHDDAKENARRAFERHRERACDRCRRDRPCARRPARSARAAPDHRRSRSVCAATSCAATFRVSTAERRRRRAHPLSIVDDRASKI